MTEIETKSVAGIGHNQPPLSEQLQVIDDLYGEASLWLDGDPLETKEQYDTLIELVKQLRKAKSAADKARKAEAKPFDDAKKRVQERYNPYIKPRTGKADMAIATAQKVLEPYLAKQAEILRKEQEAARLEAERLAERARQEFQSDNLVERESAEITIDDAKHAEAKAKAPAKQNVVKGARTVWDVNLVDSTAAMRALWMQHKPRFEALMIDIAREQVRFGNRQIDGFKITSKKVV